MKVSTALALADVEQAAAKLMQPEFWAYLAGGAGSNHTVQENSRAYNRLWFTPRLPMKNASTPDISCLLFGRRITMPILLAPTSPQRLFHEDAELATARAAHTAGTISVISTDSHFPLADIASAASASWWFQLYAYSSRMIVEKTVRLAEQHGAGALVITMDAHFPARRLSTFRSGFVTPSYIQYGILHEIGVSGIPLSGQARIERYPLTWDDIDWIRSLTALPIVLKGVMHPMDVRRAHDSGIEGVIISNHGGRQLDDVAPSLLALASITQMGIKDILIIVDGGIRCGIDVAKAIALGASAVCIGRPYLWGLFLDGEAGVVDVLSLLANDLLSVMRQLGLCCLGDLGSVTISPNRGSEYCREGEKNVDWSQCIPNPIK